MRDVEAETSYLKLVLHNDDETPADFVFELVRSVLDKPAADAIALIAKVHDNGKAGCGTYPSPVAKALLETARERIHASGHPLRITTEAITANDDSGLPRCDFCGAEIPEVHAAIRSTSACICDRCLLAGARALSDMSRKRQFKYASEALAWHFAGIPLDQLVSTSRQFPGHMRVDVQISLDKLFSAAPIRFFGIHEPHRYATLTFAALSQQGQHPHTIAPAKYHSVDIGEIDPVECLDNGLWLCRADELPFSVVLSSHREYGQESGQCVEITVPVGAAGVEFVRKCFAELESAISAARSYRGKILSLDVEADYRGRSRGIMVHRLAAVTRDDVILPEATLRVLDRNVLKFIASREGLRKLGQSTRKGILLYGPPGTGKTHTIRYLASNLAGHTTLIITAAQVGLLAQYMNLARLLQPSMVVIEDVDLIARDRESMGGPCEESLLNKLLNEMDGLSEDADILFLLTTNRPDQLEGALSGRPGRIDQAIEMPLPDESSRRKLVELYGKGLHLSDAVVREAIHRTHGVSAAFIKELMRRTAQACVGRGGGKTVTVADINEALDDMLFSGGRLNVKLLGGAQEIPTGA